MKFVIKLFVSIFVVLSDEVAAKTICHYGHCETIEQCQLAPFNTVDCNPNIEVWRWTNGTPVICKKQANCCTKDSVQNDQSVCIILRSGCKSRQPTQDCGVSTGPPGVLQPITTQQVSVGQDEAPTLTASAGTSVATTLSTLQAIVSSSLEANTQVNSIGNLTFTVPRSESPRLSAATTASTEKIQYLTTIETQPLQSVSTGFTTRSKTSTAKRLTVADSLAPDTTQPYTTNSAISTLETLKTPSTGFTTGSKTSTAKLSTVSSSLATNPTLTYTTNSALSTIETVTTPVQAQQSTASISESPTTKDTATSVVHISTKQTSTASHLTTSTSISETKNTQATTGHKTRDVTTSSYLPVPSLAETENSPQSTQTPTAAGLQATTFYKLSSLSTPQSENDLLSEPTIDYFSRILQTVDKIDSKSHNKKDGHLKPENISSLVESLEENLKRYALQDATTYMPTRKEENGCEVVIQQGDCSVFQEGSEFQKMSDFKVDYTFSKENKTQCDEFVVAFSQFHMPVSVSKTLIPTHVVRTYLSSKVGYSIVPDDIPYLSVSAYDTHNGTKLEGKIKYMANFSFSVELIEETARRVNVKAGGETIIFREIGLDCGFVDTVRNEISTAGLKKKETLEFGSVLCISNHTTVFAVMLSVQATVIPWGVRVCSYVTESLSVAFLFLTIAILFRYKGVINSDRTWIQINLCASLFFFHLLNLLHDVAILHDDLCVTLAVVTHYLLITTGIWMLLEGVRLVTSVSDKVLQHRATFTKYSQPINCSLGWGFPALLVGTATAIGLNNGTYVETSYLYDLALSQALKKGRGPSEVAVRKYDRCWLQPGTALYYAAVLGPVLLVLIVNTLIAVQVTLVLLRVKERAQKMQGKGKTQATDSALSAAKAMIILIPVLGIPWAIGFLASVGDTQFSVIMMYLNALVNGLQGTTVFLIYCVMNRSIRGKISDRNESAFYSTRITNLAKQP